VKPVSLHASQGSFQIAFIHRIWIDVIQCCFTNRKWPQIMKDLQPNDQLCCPSRFFFSGQLVHLLQIASHLIHQVFAEEERQKSQGSFRYPFRFFQNSKAHIKFSAERWILFPQRHFKFHRLFNNPFPQRGDTIDPFFTGTPVG
jgi:hypothetical protein